MLVVRGTVAMITGMTPDLIEGQFVFCITQDEELAARCIAAAVGTFHEREGTSFILPAALAAKLGFDCAMPMRQITLNVFSALDGVGLTAAVAQALAEENIACNMIAAYHHDHVFVPADAAEKALELLVRLSAANSN